jgi:hypothetical protein
MFSTMPEAVIFSKSSWIETEANRGHWGDRTLNRMRSRLNRMRSVSSSCCRGARARVLHRCVRSLAGPACPARRSEGLQIAWSIGHGGASDHDRPDTSGRKWTLTGLKLDIGCNASGQFYSAFGRCFVGAGAVCDLRVRFVQVARSVVFDRWSTESTVEIGWPRLNLRGHVDGIGRPDTVQHVRSVRPVHPVVPKIAQ